TSGVDRTFSFAHNDYLQLLAELGVTGFLILAALVLPLVATTFRVATKNRDRNVRLLALGCAGSIAAIALHSFADFNLYIPSNALLLAWILGISAALPVRQRNNASGRIPARKLALALGCLLLVYAPAWL